MDRRNDRKRKADNRHAIKGSPKKRRRRSSKDSHLQYGYSDRDVYKRQGTANIFFSFAAGFVLCVSKSGKKENRELAEILDSTRQRKNSNRGKSDLEDDSAVGYAIQQLSLIHI